MTEMPRTPKPRLHIPANAGNTSLVILAALALLFALRWASSVLVPLTLGLMFSYALTPMVDGLQRRCHLPRVLGAALLLLSLGGSLVWTAYKFSDDAVQLLESLPEVSKKVQSAVRAHRSPDESTIGKVQRAAAEIEQAAQQSGPPAPAPGRGVTRVRIERPQFNLQDYLWSGTLGLAASLGQALVVSFITFFLLVSGQTFRRKMVKIAGPSFARRRVMMQALNEVNGQIQRYLLVQLFTSVVAGLAVWISFSWLGMEYAGVWGLLAFGLDFIPYIGAIILAVTASLVGFVQFGAVDMALAVGVTVMTIHMLSGNLLSPWLMSRAARMNPVAIFVGLLLFAWLWGLWGLLLGVPVLTVVKAICDRVDPLQPIGELLGS
ncbi:AI-2E family transporter [Roseateles albus]|uniref:AI-2E family transporter n=1 Tax=Roseateles albus TaxID=2987525 RepID=A0ABT5KKE2_9BURK|nr:AI-2E family transporter [Roseateles albus]MDC8773385.1 AI-2E family transporter [Roseateles albus]